MWTTASIQSRKRDQGVIRRCDKDILKTTRCGAVRTGNLKEQSDIVAFQARQNPYVKKRNLLTHISIASDF